jgi:hypothetical protein
LPIWCGSRFYLVRILMWIRILIIIWCGYRSGSDFSRWCGSGYASGSRFLFDVDPDGDPCGSGSTTLAYKFKDTCALTRILHTMYIYMGPSPSSGCRDVLQNC